MGQSQSEDEHPSQTSSEGDAQNSFDDQDLGEPIVGGDDDDDLPRSFATAPISLTNQVKPMVSSEEPLPLPSMGQSKPETVPTQFKWTHGGEQVFVTGSFNKWQGKIVMKQNEAGEFTLVLNILPGVHQYKFIVDDVWRLNPDSPTIEDSSVTNNIIEVKRAVFEENSDTFRDSDDEEEYDDEGRKLFYGQRVKAADGKVPKMPPHLKNPMLDAPPPPPPGDSLELPLPEYVTLNHLYVYNNDSLDQQDVLVTAITQRFKTKPHASLKSKFVTTIYYAPKPKLPSLDL
jgi:5'-AMP-activated protein kinase regulatory beta subunit